MEVWHAVWPSLDPEERALIARHLLSTSRDDFHVDYTVLFTAMLDDPDPVVRSSAVDGLWERNDIRLMRRFAALLSSDGSARVRSRSAAALGRFVELAQLGRLDEDLTGPVLQQLIDVAADESEDVDVRRRAMEAAAYAEVPDVELLIEAAHASSERALRAGALRAMGNSADTRWAGAVVDGLYDSDLEVCLEAAHAAGELAVVDAVPALIGLACGDQRVLQMEAIWALGEIGGRDARRTLEGLLQEVDEDDQLQAIDDALATMALLEGMLPWEDVAESLTQEGDYGDNDPAEDSYNTPSS